MDTAFIDQRSGSAMRRFVWSPLEVAPLPPLPNPRLRGKRIVVAARRSDLSDAITATLRFQGAAVFQYDDADGDGSGFRNRFGVIDGIVDLNIDEPLTTIENGTWEPALRRTLSLLRACYDEWAQEASAERLFYLAVTRMGGTMGYGAGTVDQPLGGIWAGLAKTLPREIPNCNVRILDLSPDSLPNAAELVSRELYQPGYFEIGYREGRRYSLVARAEETPIPTGVLTASDVVLLSGGARGIGLALARELARRCGCRIVITGRTAVPSPDDPCVQLDDAALRARQYQMLKDAAGSGRLAQVRAAIERQKQQRQLFQQLARLRQEALPVEYVECDVTSLADVRTAIERAGEQLSVVIHNAGVDAPVRLPAKSDSVFRSIVRTKVDGFLNLIRALEGRPLRMFCNVGSLTGRWGGMVGEIDYAAANEGLSRLGMWAARQVSFPVKTLCWPTWERLGMIKNFDVAATYSSALPVAEGVNRWQRELVSPHSGEVMFMGALGNLGSPVYLKGFPPAEATANIGSLYTQYHYLGDVVRFRPGKELRTIHRIDGTSAPALYEFEIDGSAALPVSILLEYAIAAGDWFAPIDRQPLALQEIRDIAIDLPALSAPGGQLVFERCATDAPVAGGLAVSVQFARPGHPRSIATAVLVYGESSLSTVVPVTGSDAGSCHLDLPATSLRWPGLHLKLAAWRQGPDGRIVATTGGSRASDLWSTLRVPAATLSFAGLENILRAASAWTPGTSLRISRLISGPSGGAMLTLTGDPARQCWSAVDASGQLVVHLEGLSFTAAGERESDGERDGVVRRSKVSA